MKKGRIFRLAAVLLFCCAALPAAGTQKAAAPVFAAGGAKLKVAVMTPYPGSREKMKNQEPVKPGKQSGPVPLPNYSGETLTLGLLADGSSGRGK